MAATRNNISLIEYQNARFLITDRPTDTSLDKYLQTLKEYSVVDLVRVCEPTYPIDAIQAAGIHVNEMAFDDGQPPSREIIDQWLDVNKRAFTTSGACIAVHCVAGLGRAPIMVALSLIEMGMAPEDAVLYIRERRRGAINTKQLQFLEKYKSKAKKKDCVCM